MQGTVARIHRSFRKSGYRSVATVWLKVAAHRRPRSKTFALAMRHRRLLKWADAFKSKTSLSLAVRGRRPSDSFRRLPCGTLAGRCRDKYKEDHRVTLSRRPRAGCSTLGAARTL